jgi:tetratricopeptide (TPR) repeat protein
MSKSKVSSLKIPQDFEKNNLYSYLLILFIVLITAASFFPSLFNGFTNWDDDVYILNNSKIKLLNFANIIHIFSTTHHGGYEPLTELVFAVDYNFFKLDPFIYHFNNFIIHLLNSVLAFYLIFKISGKKIISFFTALLWAIHPMRVESVAWAAERKDVLFTLFLLVSLITYIIYSDKKKMYLYIMSIIFFLICLLPKAQGIMFPFVLILIDYFQNRKINLRSLINKIPYFIISVLFLIILFIPAKETNQIERTTASALLQNFLYANFGLVFYLIKFILPINLQVNYPLPDRIWNLPMNMLYYAAPFIVAGTAVLIFLFGKHNKKLIFAALFYFINLFIVLQLQRTGYAIVADRYTYAAYLGLSFFAVDSLFEIFNKQKNKLLQISFLCFITVLIIAFSFLTWQRCTVWKDSYTLWQDAINKNPDNSISNTNFAAANMARGNIDLAIKHYKRAIELNPEIYVPYGNLAEIYLKQKRNEKAIEVFKNGEQYNQSNYFFHHYFSLLYMRLGMTPDAVEENMKTIKLNPKFTDAYNEIGNYYFELGMTDEALKSFKKAIEINPKNASAYCNIGNIYNKFEKLDEALNYYNKAIKLFPAFEQAYIEAGIIYEKKKELKKAGEFYKTALKINPSLIAVYNSLGIVYANLGKINEAIAVWEKGLKLDPSNQNIKFNLEQINKLLQNKF